MLKRIWTDEEVEFKGQFYNIPKSRIGPKPVQKPHVPIYLGGFSPNALRRIVENDLNGWLGIIGGIAPFNYVQSVVHNFRNKIAKTNKDSTNFKIILLAYPYLNENSPNSENNADRPTLTGTVNEIGEDKKIKDLNVDHIIFAYNFSPIGKDIDKMIDLTKQFSKFAR